MSRHTPEEVPENTPGSGENICYACAGTGKLGDRSCGECGGA